MDILKIVESDLKNTILLCGYPSDIKIVVNFPGDSKNGDVYTNASMVLASHLKKNPHEIAKKIVSQLSNIYPDVEIAGPGFINIRVGAKMYEKMLHFIHEQKENFGGSSFGNEEAINLEFVSANPTGPLHVGHARGAIVGDVICNLLQKIGYRVVKEYYINDYGTQIGKLLESVYIRCVEQIKNVTSREFLERKDLYFGEYINEIAKDIVKKYGHIADMTLEEAKEVIRGDVIEMIMSVIKKDLKLLGVVHDVFTSEKSLSDSGVTASSVDFLIRNNLIYKGVPERPRSEKTADSWEEREQLLFSSTKFGDDIDRCVMKENGEWTYFAGDIAYHFDKISRGYKNMAVVLGIDHGGYVKRLESIVKVLDPEAEIGVVLYGLIKFINGEGDSIKMSKRSGNFLTVRELVENVGKDAVRFMILMFANTQVVDFDLEKVLAHSKENPIFYVQYAHARIYSVIRRVGGGDYQNISVELLSSADEISLIGELLKWPSVVLKAAKSREPHTIAFYLLSLAEKFHSLWSKGNLDTTIRFIVEENPELTKARIFLIQAVAYVFSSGLKLFGIEPVFEM